MDLASPFSPEEGFQTPDKQLFLAEEVSLSNDGNKTFHILFKITSFKKLVQEINFVQVTQT